MIYKSGHRPFYREVVAQAMKIAWHERQWWIFALFAGLLQTGGIYDVILVFTKSLGQGSADLMAGWSLSSLAAQLPTLNLSSFGGFVYSLTGLERMLFALIVGFTVLLVSCLAQGALVAGIGSRLRGAPRSLASALSMAGKHIWSIAVLNLITLGLIWFSRFLVLIPVAWMHAGYSWTSFVWYFVAFLLFLLASIVLTSVHLFSLNSLVLEDMSLFDALRWSFHLWRKSWVLILEVGAVLLVLGSALLMLTFLLFIVGSIPFAFILFATSLLQEATVFWVVYSILWLLFFCFVIAAGLFTITMNYVVWHHLYRRVSEGKIMAKAHRLLHFFTDIKPFRFHR